MANPNSKFYYGQIVHGNRDLLPDFQEDLRVRLEAEELYKQFPEFFNQFDK